MGKTPIHKMTPEQHADLGWDFGAYRDGSCLSLTCTKDARDLMDFIKQARNDGASVVDLREIRLNKREEQ
jgi:hypothetical protein